MTSIRDRRGVSRLTLNKHSVKRGLKTYCSLHSVRPGIYDKRRLSAGVLRQKSELLFHFEYFKSSHQIPVRTTFYQAACECSIILLYYSCHNIHAILDFSILITNSVPKFIEFHENMAAIFPL